MIFVFALTAAVCMQAFVYSSTLSKEGESQNLAAGHAQEVAEYCKTEQGDLDSICESLSGEKNEAADGFSVPYEEDKMEVQVQITESSALLQKADIVVKSYDGGELYSMEVAWQKGEMEE